MKTAQVERLLEASRRDASGGRFLDWPERIAASEWCFSPEWLSLHGTAAYAAMDDAARHRLALREAVGFFSANVHGERPLIGELARRSRAGTGAWPAYEAAFAAEERVHTAWFRGFCERYGGGVYADRKPATRAAGGPEDEIVFFARALVFEEIVDAYDAAMAADARLAPIVRRIHALHHRDEARHRAFGRGVVAELWREADRTWTKALVARARARLRGYMEVVWAEFYDARWYRDAGLPDPVALRREGWLAPQQRSRRERVLRPIRRVFASCGLLPEPTA